MKYFKEFPDIETYKKFAKSTALISPNVSTIANQGNEPTKFDDDVAFLHVTINVTNVSPIPQILCTNYNNVIDYIEIDDGTILNNLALDDIFYDGFTTIGNHEIKIRFKDKYKIGGSDYKHTGVFGVPSVVDVLIPNVYTEIKSYCFKNAENLSKINIPPSIKVIETDAIAGSGITFIKIPSTVDNMGYNVFKNCTKLETVDISEANFKNISDYSLGMSIFENCTSLKSLTIPKSIKNIKNNAIYNCTNLESITFEEGSHCELIGYGGITNCPKLTEITLPEGLTTLTSNAIVNCSNLTKIVLPSTIKTITSSAIAACNLKELTLPNGLETFNYGALSGPFELDELIIPNSVTNASYCFGGTPSLNKIKKLVLPTNENTTSFSNFFNSGSMSSIDVSYLEEIELPSNLTTLNSGNLMNLSNLKSITLPSSLTTLKQNCLGSCTSLTSITIPSSVTEISEGAFSRCSNLEEVIFENNSQLNILSTSAFSGCSKLSSINIPSTVSDMSQSPFLDCTSLGYVENGIRYYDLPNNLGITMINVDDDTLTSYTIKNGINISELTFINKNNMPNATSITLPEGITSLTTNNSRFKDWDTLETVNLPNSIETIEDDTFDGCTSLSQISKDLIYSINEYALGFECYLNYTNKDFSKEYFSMKFSDSTTLIISSLSSRYSSISSLEYSSDNGETWNNIKPATSNGSSVISVDKDHIYMFKGIANGFIADSNNYYQSVFSTSNVTSLASNSPKVYVFGNIMSLLKGDNFENTTINTSSNSAAFKGLFGTDSTLSYRRVLNVVGASKLILPNSISSYCYTDMFNQCLYLKSTPQLPSNESAAYCYRRMFKKCTSLINASNLSINSVNTSSCENMFEGCTSLTTAPSLPATVLSSNCYQYMFKDCTSLTTAPSLPATTVSSYCYRNMFEGCTSLTTAPSLPATSLLEITGYQSSHCYDSMFKDCTSLTTAPSLPATTLSSYCYQNMFNGCTSLTTAPSLPATTLTTCCYENMFKNCTSLTTVPELPATTLTSACYRGMFSNCTSLIKAPNLHGTTLTYNCYQDMFNGCSSLNYVKISTYDILSQNAYNNYASGWLTGVSSTGTFVKGTLDKTFYSASIPSGWTIKEMSAENYQVGDILYEVGANHKLCVSNEILNDSTARPIAICMIPAGFLGEYEPARWAALKHGSCNNPMAGGNGYCSWGNYEVDTPVQNITYTSKTCNWGAYLSDAASDTGDYDVIPSLIDSNGNWNLTELGAKNSYAITDINGKYKTQQLLGTVINQPNWETDSTITNESGAGYAPAACCCARYNYKDYGTTMLEPGDWYLGACGEMCFLQKNHSLLQEKVEALYNKFGNNYGYMERSIMSSGRIWTSSELDANYARFVSLSNGWVGYDNKNLKTSYQVIPILQY